MRTYQIELDFIKNKGDIMSPRPAFISLALLGLLLLLNSLIIFRLEMIHIVRKENALLRVQLQKEVARVND